MINSWLEIGLSNALLATGLAVLAVIVTRRMRPQWALAVWLLVLLKLLMPPLWNAPLGSLRGVLALESTAGYDAIVHGAAQSPWRPSDDLTSYRLEPCRPKSRHC